jgi:glycine cleavage system H protein
MALIPDDLKYTAEHEWVRVSADGSSARIGITDYAQQALGDVVYVSLPALETAVDQGASIGEVESTKSVSDLYAPVSGVVSARNDDLDARPELINSDPYGDGWVIEVQIAEGADLSSLIDAAAYATLSG